MISSTNSNWPDYRNDPGLRGASKSAASAVGLEEQTSLWLGGSYQEIKLVPDGTGDMVLAAGGGIQRINQRGEYIWRGKTFGAHFIAGLADLDGDGSLEILTSNGRDIVVLSALDGEILWQKSVALPLSYGTYATMFQIHRLIPGSCGLQFIVPCFTQKEVLIFDASDGARNIKLHQALRMDDAYHPTITIGDVNHDGVDEVVIARLGGVYVFDPVSGEMLSETIWQSDEERRRNYGQFQLCDIDNDGDLEAIILSDKVSRHIAVLDNDGLGIFSPMWDRFIEHIYPNDTTELRFAFNSVQDVTGDGLPEITVSIFNEARNNRWETLVLEAATGAVLGNYPDRYLRGIQDVDQEGTFELLLSKEERRTLKPHSEISIVKATGGQLWSAENASFAARTMENRSDLSRFKPDIFADEEVWVESFEGELRVFFFAHDGSSQSLKCVTPDPDYIERTYFEFAGTNQRIALIQNDRIYLSSESGEIHVVPSPPDFDGLKPGYHLTTEAHIAARPGALATAISFKGSSFVAVPTTDDEVVIYQSYAERLREHARIKGRGKIGYDSVFHSVPFDEFEGEPCLILVDDADIEHAQLSYYSLEGKCLQSFDFPGIPAHTSRGRTGIYDWRPFDHSSGAALFVSAYESTSMNSERSFAISRERGKLLWELRKLGEGEYGRGVGAWGASSMHSVNGMQEVIFCAKDTIIRIDLETGKLTHPPKLLTSYTADEMRRHGILKEQGFSTWSTIDDPFSAYGSVILEDIDGDGVDELICVSSFGGFGVLRDDMSAMWWRISSFGDVLYRMPAVCDIDNDGRIELIQGHSTGLVRVYDALTGEIISELDLEGITTDIISSDLDGDGIIECVTGTNDGRLIILQMLNGQLAIKREWQLGSSAGSPMIAEIDSRPTIFVASGDGRLRQFS